MRQIGTLTGESAAKHLADHLLSLGVPTRIREEPEGWGLWVVDEDRMPLARQEFDAFRGNPDDPRFQAAPKTAETIRRESERKEKLFRKNYRPMSGTWDRPNFRRRPLTLALIVACVVVFLLMKSSRKMEVLVENALAFSSLHVEQVDGQLRLTHGGLEDILHGQVWRLISPAFLHFNLIHLLFDLWALALFGSLIEYRRGTRTLALLVLITAIVSNLGEGLYELHSYGHTMTFGGMSGVVYALFGYVWMKGRNEPEQGMILHPSNVQTMLFWLVLCMTGFVGNIANAAHVFGLVAGILCGLARI